MPAAAFCQYGCATPLEAKFQKMLFWNLATPLVK